MVDLEAVLARIDERTEHMQGRLNLMDADHDKIRAVAYGTRDRLNHLLDSNGSSDLERRIDERIRRHTATQSNSFREWAGFIFGLCSLVVAILAFLSKTQL